MQFLCLNLPWLTITKDGVPAPSPGKYPGFIKYLPVPQSSNQPHNYIHRTSTNTTFCQHAFPKGDAQFIASTIWGTTLSLTPEPTKAKLRGGVRKARKKSWKKTKTIIRGEPSEDQMSIVESQRSRKSNTETEEGTEDPPKPPSNPETGSTSNATGDNASMLWNGRRPYRQTG